MKKTLDGRPVRLVRLMLRTWVSLDTRSGIAVCSRPMIMESCRAEISPFFLLLGKSSKIIF